MIFSQPMIKGEVVPLLGKWILIKYWCAAGDGVRKVMLNYFKKFFMFSAGL